MEVRKGDIVQAGVMISNSEVGLGAVSIQPLVYRLVCTNNSDVLVISDVNLITLYISDFTMKKSE